MNSKDLSDLIDVLRELHATAPNLHFGQLIANLATAARGPVPEAVWDVADNELLQAATSQLSVLQSRENQPSG